MTSARLVFCQALITFTVVALTTSHAGAIEVAFVVTDDPETIQDLTNAGDVLIADFLISRGYDVTLVGEIWSADDKLDASELADLTIVSESISSNSVANQLNETTTPLITAESCG
jgi:hypothetical protein